MRGTIAGAALLLGYVSTTQTLAFALIKSNTVRGHTLAPDDGRIAGELAEQILTSGQPARRASADRLARAALVDEPLAVPALTARALAAQIAGDTAQARRLFVHSDRLSRRELNTRLWLIEDAVARGDVPGALRHYDIALRTSRTAADLLYPVLAQAIADPTIVRALITKLAARPPWRDAFLDYVGGRGPSPVRSAQFFSQLAKAGIAIPEVPRISVVNALARDGSYQEAWAYYRTLRSGVIRQRSRDPDFTAQLQTPSVFDWMPVMNDAGVTASVNDGVFDFAAPSTVGGVILQQIQLLPAGRYRLAGTSVGIDQPREARPYWQLTCTDGKEIGRVELTNSADNAGRFAGTIDVGGNCPVQLLRLVVRPSAVIGGVSGQIDRALLAPDGKGR